MNTQSCDCRRVEPGYDNLRDPGDFYIQERGPQTWIGLVLPDGTRNFLPIDGTTKNAVGASWKWDGNLDRPTLEPSIFCIDHWHGFLRGGRLVSC